MITITENAIRKLKDVLATLSETGTVGIRLSIIGGGCSGFSYKMALEKEVKTFDKTYNFDGVKVIVDQASMLYLEGTEVDYIETLESSGFKFNNPHVKRTCGCGSSFNM